MALRLRKVPVVLKRTLLLNCITVTEGFSDEFYDRWQHLLEDIEMSEIPMNFVRDITVNTTDGQLINFDVSALLDKGLKVEEIEAIIEGFLLDNDEDVLNIEFHINIKAVADEVTTKVSKILDR